MSIKNNQLHIEDHYLIPLSREIVWQQLNDPETLAACIKGCSAVERETETRFNAMIEGQIAAYRRTFKIVLDVEKSRAPTHYRLTSKASASLLGTATGAADVTLHERSDQTQLHYIAIITGTGLIRTIGLPLIENIAKKRIRDFFQTFSQTVTKKCS